MKGCAYPNQIVVVLQVLQVYHKQHPSNAHGQGTSKAIWFTVIFNLELEKPLVDQWLIPHDGDEEEEGEEEGHCHLYCAPLPDEDDAACHEKLLDHDNNFEPPIRVVWGNGVCLSVVMIGMGTWKGRNAQMAHGERAEASSSPFALPSPSI